MKEIITRRGEVILVDDEDHDSLSALAWHLCPVGYAQNHKTFMHRKIMGLVRGDGLQVDHINGNKLDNRRKNLRVCTASENARNRGPTKNNRSGFKGIGFDPARGLYMAKIQVQGKQKNLGRFTTAEEAHAAYCAAATKIHGEFANHGNDPGFHSS